MIFKNLPLYTYVNIFSAGILRTTYVSLSLINLLPIFQELKKAINSRKEGTNWAILYSVSSQGPTISNVVSRISSFSLV